MDQRQQDQQELQQRERADLEARHREEYLTLKADSKRRLDELRARQTAERRALHHSHTEDAAALAAIVWEDGKEARIQRRTEQQAERRAAREREFNQRAAAAGLRPRVKPKGPPGPEDSGF